MFVEGGYERNGLGEKEKGSRKYQLTDDVKINGKYCKAKEATHNRMEWKKIFHEDLPIGKNINGDNIKAIYFIHFMVKLVFSKINLFSFFFSGFFHIGFLAR